jgi:starch synthase
MGAGSDESCRAALEAMAAGRPVVGRRVGALPETVVHGVTGLLVDDDRPESVAAALRVLVARPEQAAAMGRAGRERARTLFGSDAHAAQVERVYRRIVESREPGR